MREFLLELLQAVATAAVPVCAAFLVQFLRRKSEQVKAQTSSVTARELLAEVTEAVTAAVACTSQTYVDALKHSGRFDADAQRKAAQKALAVCLASISPAAQDFVEAVYGDIRKYLTTRIEAEVRKQKIQGDIITLGEPFTDKLVRTVETTVEKTVEKTED